MTPRTLTFVILATLLAFGSPASAADKKKSPKQAARTWKDIVDYVFKNGDEDPILAPASRTMGYDSDEVNARSLGLDSSKSKDGRDHSIFIVYEKDSTGVAIPKEFVLATTLVKEVDSNKVINGYQIRMSLFGTPIRGMHATGIVGHVVQQALLSDSKELLSVLKNERTLHLKEIDLAQLTK